MPTVSHQLILGRWLLLLVILAVSCDSVATALPPTEDASAPSVKIADAGAESATFYGYTNQNARGNRWVTGQGALPTASPLDIELEGVPQWVVAAPWGSGSLWVVVLEEGQVQAFSVAKGQVQDETIAPDRLPPGMPPLLRVRDGIASLLMAAGDDASPWSPPLHLDYLHSLAYVDGDGDLVLAGGTRNQQFALNALPDARLLRDQMGQIILLSGATDSYRHGVLGDRLEASSMTVVDLRAKSPSVLDIPIPGDDVAEGIAPILADLNGDGRDEMVLTLSNARVGARLAVLDSTGQIIAEGPAIGRGGRWRHQLVVAPLGPKSEIELVDVLTPHLGGVVEFFRMEGADLRLAARLPLVSPITFGLSAFPGLR